MEDTAQRLTVFPDFREETGDVVRRTGICLDDLHRNSAFAQALRKSFRFRSGCAAAAGEHQVPRTALDEPVGKDLAEAAKRAGDEVAAVRFDFEFRRNRFPRPGKNVSGNETMTLPVCFPPAMSRKAAPMLFAGKARNGSGRRMRCSTRSAISASISLVTDSSPAKTASIATT